MSKTKYYFSKSLEKGLNILSLFNRETRVLTQSAIARQLGLNMTTTFRYINTLVEMGYLEKDERTKEIRPSISCLLMCNNLMRATDHLRLIKEVVDQIHGAYNISIDLAFVVDDMLMRIYHRAAEETLTYSLPDLSRGCLHNTALGKAYLTSLPNTLMAAKVEGLDLTPKTGRTIVDKQALVAQLTRAKAKRFIMCKEEYLPGLVTIGAPLFDPLTGKGVGAVCFDFSVLQHSADEIQARYAPKIIETAARLSKLLPPDKNRRT